MQFDVMYEAVHAPDQVVRLTLSGTGVTGARVRHVPAARAGRGAGGSATRHRLRRVAPAPYQSSRP